MTDVRQWLAALGLEKYVALFAEHEITEDALPHLTEEDLTAIGVALGARRRILAALPALAEPAPAAPPREAERRQITVMFCDLVGSTALAETLDPEDLRALMQSYQKAAGEVIERYGGHVAQYLGDGLMTYFGWPQAHEDDAERAVRASLDIVEAVNAMELQVRIGIATGPVVVGETGAGDASVPKLAVGETPNLAARLQGLAEADDIVVGASTRRLLGGTFELVDLGEQTLKGIVEPVQAHRVTAVAVTEGRFQAAHGMRLTALVGRDAEIAMLMERWQRAKAGEGQVMLLSGEPGIGKSRITQVLRDHVVDEPQIQLRYQCSPYYSNSALYPVIEQFERAAEFGHDDIPERKLDKMLALLGQASEDASSVAPLFASMLSIDAGNRYPPLNASPQKQKERTLQALADQVVGLAHKQPVLMIFEDAHWIDPTSQAVLELVVPIVAAHRVLLVITYRPELTPPWSGYGHVTTLDLNRLSGKQGAEMVTEVAGGKRLPQAVLDRILARTDGVPLFVEELTKAVLEAGFLEDIGESYALNGPLPPMAIPDTLRDSLMARLDRLADAKEVAQIGAVIGREFHYDLVSNLAELDERDLRGSLTKLEDSGLVFRRGEPPKASYSFKNTLVQEAAYASLLKQRRQMLHARVAQLLSEESGALSRTQPELLAHHYTEAGEVEAAVKHWLEAGRQAAQRSANQEAIAHLDKGLAIVDGIVDEALHRRLEITLNLALGTAIQAAHGYVAPADAAFQRALTLSDAADRTHDLFEAMFGLWLFHHMRREFTEAYGLADRLLDLADRHRQSDYYLQGHHAAWTTSMTRGDLVSARRHASQGREIYDPQLHRDHKFLYGGHDPGVCSRTVGGLSLWLLGFPNQARRSFEEAVALARSLAHPHSLAQALTFGSWVAQGLHDPETVRAFTDEAISLAREYGLAAGFLGRAEVMSGWAIAVCGVPEEGLQRMKQGLVTGRTAGAAFGTPCSFTLMSEILLKVGRTDEALEMVDEALQQSDNQGEYWWYPESLRCRGVVMQAIDPANDDAVVAAFECAIAESHKRQAKSLELRAATSLARLWQSQGKTTEARELLAPVYAWFTEGFDTADLVDAKALLDDLA